MTLITNGYRDQYRQIHDAEAYGQRGWRWGVAADKTLRAYGCESVLDYGCGTGSLGDALAARGYTVHYYDPAVRGWDGMPVEAVDGIVCTDVLEHVEPDCLADVLSHMRGLMRRAGLLVISTRPARKHLPDGRNAHAIVATKQWWDERLSRVFHVKPRPDWASASEFVCEVTP